MPGTTRSLFDVSCAALAINGSPMTLPTAAGVGAAAALTAADGFPYGTLGERTSRMMAAVAATGLERLLAAVMAKPTSLAPVRATLLGRFE